MKKTLYFLAFTVLVLAASCNKKTDNPNSVVPVSPYGTYSSMNDIYNLLRNQPKYVTIDAGAGGSFYGNSGTRYIVQPNSFMDAAGNSITGNVQVVVTEYLQKGDMIFSKMLTVSYDEPILSGGEFNISANQGGTKLFLKPFYYVQANIPQGKTPIGGLLFFSGNATGDTSVNTVNWNNKVDSSAHGTGGAIVYNGDTVNVISDSLKECNADAFMTSPNFQNFNVTVSVTGATLLSSVKVYGYVLFDSVKAVWPLGEIGSYANGVFNEQHTPNIPVHFALFTLINNKFYAGVAPATPLTGKNYTVTLTETDPTAFKGQLNTLVN